jgi:acid phosphatase
MATTSSTGSADAGVPDSSVADGSVPDTSVPDASVPDASVADASVADTSVADTSVADTGSTGGGAKFDYMVIILMENHGYSEINGVAPYMTGLANQYANLQNYTAVLHDSEPNYVTIFGASNHGIGSTTGGGDGTCCYWAPGGNIVDQLESKRLTWRAYAEDATGSGTCAFNPPRSGDHYPFIDYTDMNTAARCANMLTTSSSNDAEFIAEMNGNNPANFIWLTPIDGHNMHDNSVSSGDSYLKGLVPQILSSKLFTTKRAALFIVFDEGSDEPLPSGFTINGHSDRVYAVWAGPGVKGNAKPSSNYSHYSVLATIDANWGLSPVNNNDGTANAMLTEVFR